MARKTDPELLMKAVEMYRQGQTGREVARLTCIAESVVYRALKAEGINAMALQRRGERGHANRRFTDGQETQIVQEYLDGASLSGLGKTYGVTLQTIRNALRRQNVGRRARGRSVRQFTDAQAADIAAHWQAGESQSAIAAAHGTHQTVISRLLNNYGYSKETRHAHGDRHGSWRGGRWRVGGYVMVAVPSDSPFASMRNTQGYVMEHRLVMAQALGRALMPEETVHHINGVTTDNAPGNLQVRQGKHGKGEVHVCLDCGSHNIGTEEIT